MIVSAPTRFDVADVAPRIGCTIETDKETLLSGAKTDEIREILERRGVIVFPEIGLTDEEQIAFTHTLGTFAHEEGEGSGEKDAVYPITMDETINPIASYLKGAFYWHIDGTMSDKPILASIMSARQLSKTGGETEFCNTYAAWDDLPSEEKVALETLKVVHTVWRSQLYWRPEPSYAELKQWQEHVRNTLKMVWKHSFGSQ